MRLTRPQAPTAAFYLPSSHARVSHLPVVRGRYASGHAGTVALLAMLHLVAFLLRFAARATVFAVRATARTVRPDRPRKSPRAARRQSRKPLIRVAPRAGRVKRRSSSSARPVIRFTIEVQA